MTLNELNGIIAFILHFSPNLIALLASYVTVVEDRPIYVRKILSASYSLPLLAITNSPCSAVSLR